MSAKHDHDGGDGVERHVLAGVSCGVSFVVADALVRWLSPDAASRSWSWISHAAASLALYATVGLGVGAAMWTIVRLRAALSLGLASLGARSASIAMEGALAPLCAALAALVWVGSATSASIDDGVGWAGRFLAAVIAGSSAALAPYVMDRAGSRRARYAVATASLLTGVVCAWVDMTVLVALYPVAHALAEITVWACWLVAWWCYWGMWLGRLPRAGRVLVAGSVVVGFAGIVTGGWLAARLAHTAQHEAYLGRMLARGQRLMPARAEVTRQRQDERGGAADQVRLASGACPAAWMPTDARAAPSDVREAVAALGSQPNIAIFYVDTLRADVASDPRVMPNLAGLAEESISFSRVYATGSDTRSSLPAMIRGSYDLARTDEHDMLRVARARGYDTALNVPISAKDFLDKNIRQFAFDEVMVTRNAGSAQRGWGYGAIHSTSENIVDEGLAWLARRDRRKPFLMWQFHYDLHGWSDWDSEDIALRARHYGISQHDTTWKYRTMAASVDEQLGRFLRGLERVGHADDTVVVFVADHGEGLGRQGFWLHAVFLWEGMLRVPLHVRIPGVKGRRVDGLVSLVDFGPTLVRMMNPSVSLTPYHGEDLLTRLDDNPAERRYPILMRSLAQGEVTRLGVVNASGTRKLVVPLETGQPELLDLTAPVPDDVDLAGAEGAVAKELMSIVMDGPMNPRAGRRHRGCHRLTSTPGAGSEEGATARQIVRTSADDST